ncbi:hypothetical protein AABB24_028249 [Solanum stoloniferum]
MMVISQVNQKSFPWLSGVCCEWHPRYVDDTWTGCHYFLLISWLIVLFRITCFISEQELLVAVLRSVSKIQLLVLTNQMSFHHTQLTIKQPFTKFMSGAFRRSDYELIRLQEDLFHR